MQVIMNKRWRHIFICALIAVGSAVGARLLSDIRFFQLLHLKALDAEFVLRDRLGLRENVANSNIVLVVMDNETLTAFHEPMIFWHPYYAETIRAAGQAGAKA